MCHSFVAIFVCVLSCLIPTGADLTLSFRACASHYHGNGDRLRINIPPLPTLYVFFILTHRWHGFAFQEKNTEEKGQKVRGSDLEGLIGTYSKWLGPTMLRNHINQSSVFFVV